MISKLKHMNGLKKMKKILKFINKILNKKCFMKI